MRSSLRHNRTMRAISKTRPLSRNTQARARLRIGNTLCYRGTAFGAGRRACLRRILVRHCCPARHLRAWAARNSSDVAQNGIRVPECAININGRRWKHKKNSPLPIDRANRWYGSGGDRRFTMPRLRGSSHLERPPGGEGRGGWGGVPRALLIIAHLDDKKGRRSRCIDGGGRGSHVKRVRLR